MFGSSEIFYGKKNDHQLEKVLKERIAWDKRVSLQDVQIEAISGHVILTGKVDAEYKKEAIIDTVRRTEGVWEIDCKIEVDPFMSRTDEEILRILDSVMGRLWLKPGEEIKVKVSNGVVTLDGVVSRRHIKSLAGSLAWELSGVKDVNNFIELKEPLAIHVRITPSELMQFV